MITFNLDSFPNADFCNFSSDYNSLLVRFAMSDTLFRYDGNVISELACKTYKTLRGGQLYKFILRDDLYFSNGKKVTAKDYLERITVCIEQKNFIDIELNNIKEIIAQEQILIIKLKTRDKHFYKIFSNPNLAPLSGPFALDKFNKNKILLIPNKYHRLYTKYANNLTFLKIRTFNQDINNFKKRVSNFTSNTSFKYSMTKNYKDNIFIYQNFITMALSFININLLDKKNIAIRRAILCSIDKDKISEYFNGFILPTDNFLLSYDNIYNKQKIVKPLEKTNISIGYDDFYPNKIIAEFIKAQLLKSNIKVNLVKDDYYNPQFNYDMKLSLFFPEYLDDLSFYRSGYNKTLLKFINNSIPNNIYKKAFVMRFLYKLNKLLLDNALIIPLFKMNSVYLSNYKDFDFRICNFETFLSK